MKEHKMEENLKLKLNKERVTDQLEKRNKERQQNNETYQELRNQDASESEAIEYFDKVFDGIIHDIENDLKNVQPGNTKLFAPIFVKINNSIQDLQKYLSNSTIFLTDYKIKTCQNTINELTIKTDEIKTKLIPKKKFGFKQKKNENLIEVDNKIIEKEIKNENVQKLQKFDWTVSNECDKMFLLEGSAVNNRDLTLSNLKNCIVQLHGHPGSLQMSNLTSCIILCGPIARSVFAENCHDCKFAFACQQLRLHSSKSCDTYLHVTCRAIIEDCRDICVAPYNYKYSQLTSHFTNAGLDIEKNNWNDVGDFNWLSPDKPSPNWRKMSDVNYIFDWTTFLEDVKLKYQNC